jgi:hypothetical protein
MTKSKAVEQSMISPFSARRSSVQYKHRMYIQVWVKVSKSIMSISRLSESSGMI